MLVENIRDKKLISIYTALTGSDLKGNFEEEQLVSMLYAMMCIDLARKDYPKYFEENLKSPFSYTNYAKELLRVYETSLNGEHDENSIVFLTDALFNYLSRNNISYNDVHSMNSYELKKKIYESVCLVVE